MPDPSTYASCLDSRGNVSGVNLNSTGSTLFVLHDEPTTVTTDPLDPYTIVAGSDAAADHHTIADVERSYLWLELRLAWHTDASPSAAPQVQVFGAVERQIKSDLRRWPQDAVGSFPTATGTDDNGHLWINLPDLDDANAITLGGTAVVNDTTPSPSWYLGERTRIPLYGAQKVLVTVSSAAAFSSGAGVILGRFSS